MKKLILFMICLVLLLALPMVCHAGSIPEDLVTDENARVYFGLVSNVEKKLFGGITSITVVEYQNVKGEFVEGRATVYDRFDFTDNPIEGKIYLCGYYDDNNPLHLWGVSGMDPATLQIYNTDDMSQRMQKYLNEGRLTDADYTETAVPAGEVTDKHFDYSVKKPLTNGQLLDLCMVFVKCLVGVGIVVVVMALVRKWVERAKVAKEQADEG